MNESEKKKLKIKLFEAIFSSKKSLKKYKQNFSIRYERIINR